MEQKILIHQKTKIRGVFVKEYENENMQLITEIKLESGAKYSAPSNEFKEYRKMSEEIYQRREEMGKPSKLRKPGSGLHNNKKGGRPLNPSGEKKVSTGFTFRPDVIRTLKTIKNRNKYVEDLILNSFITNGIELI
jgi:hypothetical protein